MTGLEKHRNLLADAVKAIENRGFWSAYSEVPRTYGETLPAEGKAAFEALLDEPFALDQAAEDGRVGGEISPFGRTLGITYPRTDSRYLSRALVPQLPGLVQALSAVPDLAPLAAGADLTRVGCGTRRVVEDRKSVV